MSVARIISSSFEDALKFAEYLRPVFDTVEIAQPGRAYDTAVDLEVNLELCTVEQAWQQVAQFGSQPDADVFVAPGALTQVPGVKGEEMPVAPDLESSTGAAPLAMPEGFEEASREAEAGIVQASAAVASAAGSNGSASHRASAEGSHENGSNWLGRTRETLRQWLAVRALLREIRQMEQQRLAEEQQRQRQMALQFERERREREARELALARAAEQQQLALQEAEQERLRQEEVQRREQEAILLRQAEEEELQRQAEQEEAIRRGVFVEEILRRRAQEQAAPSLVPAASLDAEAVPVEFQAVPADSFAAANDSAPVVRFGFARQRDRWKPAMALAGVTSVLLMAVLVGYAHRRPASPVPLSVLQRSTVVEQKVPFGAAVLPAPEPAAIPVASVAVETVPENTVGPNRHGFRRDFRRVRVDSHEVDYVADDVTVRHFDYRPKTSRPRSSLTHSAAPVPITASTRGVKQISDME